MKTHMKIIFPILGAVCLFIPGHVTRALPYLIGGAMVLVSISSIGTWFQNHEFRERFSENLSFGLMMGIMGLFFLLKGAKSLGAIGTTWAIIGILKASKSLENLLKAICTKSHWGMLSLEFLIRLGLALLLLFDPSEHITTHVAILGLEMIFTQIPFTKKGRSSFSA